MSPSRRTASSLASILVPMITWVVASCATNSEGESSSSNDASTSSDASSPDASGSGDDGGCAAGDERCVGEPIRCEDADWCPVPIHVNAFYTLTTVWGSGKNDVWATGSGGTVIHWDGATWKPTTVPSDSELPVKDTFRALWGSGPNDVWIASATNMIFHSDGFQGGDAAVWVRAPSADTSTFDRGAIYVAWGSSTKDLRFGGAYKVGFNQLLKVPSVPPGAIAWERLPGRGNVNGIWGSSADDVWLLVDERPFGKLVAMTLHGQRSEGDFVWSRIDSQADVVFRGIWGSGPNDVWAVGGSGTIRHFGPGATEWEIIDSPTTEDLYGVWGSGPDDVWAVGASGTILHWDGASFKPSVAAFAVVGKRPHLYGVWGSGPSDVWIVGDDVALHYTGGEK